MNEPADSISVDGNNYDLVAEAASEVSSLPRAINLIGTDNQQNTLLPNIILSNSKANSTYADKKVREGDAVLFERGSEFRTNDLMRDVVTNAGTSTNDCYTYLFMSEGTLYGAYGEGDKPKFIDSYKNYAKETWTKLEGHENIWVIDAPEVIIDNQYSERYKNNKYNGDNNTYYYNLYVRNTALAVREYKTAIPADYMAQHGTTENTSRTAKTAANFLNAMTAFDTGANSRFFWGGVQVTSGN